VKSIHWGAEGEEQRRKLEKASPVKKKHISQSHENLSLRALGEKAEMVGPLSWNEKVGGG